MRHAYILLGVATALGISLFLLIFFVLPKPESLTGPYYFPVHLPQALNRATPLASTPEHAGATITFVGDIMLARSVEESIIENGLDNPFAKLGDLLVSSDLVVGNFEGTVREQRNIEVTNQMSFDTTPDNVGILSAAGFTHLSLANNHADDYGPKVTLGSRQAITDNGMVPFGDPLHGEQFIARENVNGVSISIIGYHAFGEKINDILDAITAEHEQGRFVIVYPHWGVEYATEAPSVETYPAQLMVNAGADLIVGAHPHVIQNIEFIDGVPVIYSLGNFLFDQDFSKETQQGLVAQVAIDNDSINIVLKPVSIKNRQTLPMDATSAQKIFDTLGLPNGQLSVPRQ